MDKMLVIGTAALVLTLGAAGGAANAASDVSPSSGCATAHHANHPGACRHRHAYRYRHYDAPQWAADGSITVRTGRGCPNDADPRYADPGYDHPGCAYGVAPVWGNVGLPEYITGDYSNYF